MEVESHRSTVVLGIVHVLKINLGAIDGRIQIKNGIEYDYKDDVLLKN